MSIRLIFVFTVTTWSVWEAKDCLNRGRIMVVFAGICVLLFMWGWLIVSRNNVRQVAGINSWFVFGCILINLGGLGFAIATSRWLSVNALPKLEKWVGPTPATAAGSTAIHDGFDDLNPHWHPSDYMMLDADNSLKIMKVDSEYQMWIRPGGAKNPKDWWRIIGPRKIIPSDLPNFDGPKLSHPIEVRFLKFGPDRPDERDSSSKNL